MFIIEKPRFNPGHENLIDALSFPWKIDLEGFGRQMGDMLDAADSNVYEKDN